MSIIRYFPLILICINTNNMVNYYRTWFEHSNPHFIYSHLYDSYSDSGCSSFDKYIRIFAINNNMSQQWLTKQLDIHNNYSKHYS
jgi:hypothetical protein